METVTDPLQTAYDDAGLPWICIFFLRRVQMIYLDNGATSFPKPPEVLAAFMEAAKITALIREIFTFMAARTAHEIFRARLAIASLFGIEDPGRIIFTKNCTEAINIALAGILRRGDHVVTSSMEHNSVMRPLWHLAGKGVEVTVVNATGGDGCRFLILRPQSEKTPG